MRSYILIMLCACNSAVVNVERTSSGAVEQDPKFEPQTGTDHHYISLPAYPLANCTDTLVYDRLNTEMYRAVAYAGVLRPLPADAVETKSLLAAVLRVARGPAGQALAACGDLDGIEKLLETGRLSLGLAKTLLTCVTQLSRTNAALAASIDHERATSPLQQSVQAAEAFTQIIEDIRHRTSPTDLQRMRTAVKAADATATGLITDDEFDRLLVAATSGRFTKDTIGQLDLDYPGLAEDAARTERDAFASAASTFVDLAPGYGTTPCAAAQRYRYFYGYPNDTGTSWIDRDTEAQQTELARLACDLDIELPGRHCSGQRSCMLGQRCPEDHDTCTGPACWPKPAFAFLHFSDVQIREPGATLGGTGLSRDLRNIEPSFEQDYEQQQYAMFVYNALVETANAEIDLKTQGSDRLAPQLMIHTGDSADMGLQSEFDTFLTYTNKLHVPWYQALGNHDVLAFGNLRLSSATAKDRPNDDICQGWGSVPCTCTNLNTLVREQVTRTPDNRGHTSDAMPDEYFTAMPMLLKRICIIHAIAADWFVMDPDKQAGGNPVTSFILSHCGGWHPKPGDGTEAPTSCTPPSLAQDYARRPAIDDGRCAVLDDAPESQASRMHGFDLGPHFRLPIAAEDRDLGYYCFQIKAKDNPRRVWAVVLNTNTDAGAYGVFPDQQQNWLRKLLPTDETCAKPAANAPGRIGCDDLVMLFAHHPVYAIYDQQQRLALTDIMTRSRNVIGMFIGHHHRSGLRVIRPLRGGGHAKWEVMGPSVIDYPQAAREVTIKTAGELGYVEVLTFSPHGTGAGEDKVRAAERGAIRDKCRNDHKMCPDGSGRIHLPDRNVTFPRLFFKLPEASANPNAPHARTQ